MLVGVGVEIEKDTALILSNRSERLNGTSLFT
jgi:hypothetical protein